MGRFSFHLVHSCWERPWTRLLVDGALMGLERCHVEHCEGCLMRSPAVIYNGLDMTLPLFKIISPDPSLEQASKEQHVQIIIGPGGVLSKSGVQCLVPLVFDWDTPDGLRNFDPTSNTFVSIASPLLPIRSPLYNPQLKVGVFVFLGRHRLSGRIRSRLAKSSQFFPLRVFQTKNYLYTCLPCGLWKLESLGFLLPYGLSSLVIRREFAFLRPLILIALGTTPRKEQ